MVARGVTFLSMGGCQPGILAALGSSEDGGRMTPGGNRKGLLGSGIRERVKEGMFVSVKRQCVDVCV